MVYAVYLKILPLSDVLLLHGMVMADRCQSHKAGERSCDVVELKYNVGSSLDAEMDLFAGFLKFHTDVIFHVIRRCSFNVTMT